MDLDSEEYWKKRLLRLFNDGIKLKSFNKESCENEEHIDVNENRGDIIIDEDFHLEWDDSSHLFWYEDFGDSDMSLLSLTVSDCKPQDTLVVQNGNATGECVGSRDGGVTETINEVETKQWIASNRYYANMENETAVRVTAELSPILTVPILDLRDLDRDPVEFEQVQLPLPKLKPCYSLCLSPSAFITAADPAKVTMMQCLQSEKVLRNNTGVSKCVPLPMVTSFMSATAMLGTGYCCAVLQSYQTSPTAVLLYEPEPLLLDLTAVVYFYTMDQFTSALKLLHGHGLKLVMYIVIANAFIILLYNEIGSTFTHRYLKLFVRLLALACLALLLMLYVANVMYGHTQFKVMVQLLVIAATANIFLLVYDKFRLTANYGYPKFYKGKMESATVTFIKEYFRVSFLNFSIRLLFMPDPVDCCFSNIFDIALVFTANSDHYEFTCANKYKSALGLDLGKTLVSFSAACKLPQFGLYKLAPLLTFYLECTAVSKLLELLRTLLLASYVIAMLSQVYEDLTLLLLITALYPALRANKVAHSEYYLLLHERDQVQQPPLLHVLQCGARVPYRLGCSVRPRQNLIMSAMDTDNYRSQMDVMMLLTLFHFGNLVVVPDLHMNAVLDLFIAYDFDYFVECSAAPKLSYVEMSPSLLYNLLMGQCCEANLDIPYHGSDLGTLGSLDQVDLPLLHHGYPAFVPLSNPLYFVDEVDLTQLHQGYPALMLLTNALYVADYSEISELAQLSSKLTSPPLLHGLDMDQGYEANLSTIDSQDHADVVLLSCLCYRGH